MIEWDIVEYSQTLHPSYVAILVFDIKRKITY